MQEVLRFMEMNRVCADIDLDAAIYNMEEMHKNLSPETKMMAVVKTDAYGHGAVMLARALEPLPYLEGFAVATSDEALALRRSGIKKTILILGYTFSDSYEEVIQNDICPTLISYEMAKQYSDAAVALNKDVKAHLKIDTGMGRIGFPAQDPSAEDEILRIFSLPKMIPAGIFTHFSKSDYADKSDTKRQYELFCRTISDLKARGLTFELHHCANSAAILEFTMAQMDMVRAGVTLYGMWPSDEVNHSFPIAPVLSLHSHVVFVKKIPAGTPISYGGTFVSDREMTVATIPVGYGDGYARSLSNKGSVLIHGKRASILGRICMDQLMVDVSDISDVRVTDPVTLIGKDGDDEITMEELGTLSGRFNYEFACDLGSRIPRRYFLGNKLVGEYEQ